MDNGLISKGVGGSMSCHADSGFRHVLPLKCLSFLLLRHYSTYGQCQILFTKQQLLVSGGFLNYITATSKQVKQSLDWFMGTHIQQSMLYPDYFWGYCKCKCSNQPFLRTIIWWYLCCLCWSSAKSFEALAKNKPVAFLAEPGCLNVVGSGWYVHPIKSKLRAAIKAVTGTSWMMVYHPHNTGGFHGQSSPALR